MFMYYIYHDLATQGVSMIYFPVLRIKGAFLESGGKRIHWGGVEPPPLALGSELEGKDDNRFTTSVMS